MQRRSFLRHAGATTGLAGLAGLAGLSSLASAPAWGAAAVSPQLAPGVKARVIVVGGGLGGATVAKYLRLWGDAVEVLLIDRLPKYTSNILSSLVLTGQRSMADLRFDHRLLRDRYGVRLILGDVVEIDPVATRVVLADGRRFRADRIVLAPGIDFDVVPGLEAPEDQLRMPHAWKAGAQTAALARQLAAMPDNGTVVLTIPKVPYRCPPGPYERACLIADWLKRNKRQAHLLVLDANADFVAERVNFGNAFYGLHADVIEYRTDVEISHVDARTRTLYTNGGAVSGDVVNLIPRQRCGALAARTGLATAVEGRFAPVDMLSYQSTVAPTIHVVGDASQTTQPKAGHIANQAAKVCADALSRILAGGSPDPAPVTNSACYSTITMSKASWLTAVFQYDPATRAMVPVPAASGESEGWDGDNFEEMLTWFRALMADSFA